MIQEQVQAQRPSHCLAIIVLLIILVFAILYAIAQFGANIATQTSDQGQCLNNGQGFNGQQEAFTLAQEAEQYRSAYIRSVVTPVKAALDTSIYFFSSEVEMQPV